MMMMTTSTMRRWPRRLWTRSEASQADGTWGSAGLTSKPSEGKVPPAWCAGLVYPQTALNYCFVATNFARLGTVLNRTGWSSEIARMAGFFLFSCRAAGMENVINSGEIPK